MALGAIFGALSGLANLGQQRGEAQDLVNQETIRRLALANQQEELRQRTAESDLRRKELEQRIGIENRPKNLGEPYVRNGKRYALFIDPATNKATEQELPGGAPETDIETLYRGYFNVYKLAGKTDAEASTQAIDDIQRKLQSKGTTRSYQPDPTHPGWGYTITSDIAGNELGRVYGLLPASYDLKQTTTVGTSELGVPEQKTATTKPGYSLYGATGVPGQGIPPTQAQTSQGAPPGAQQTPSQAISPGFQGRPGTPPTPPAAQPVPGVTTPAAGPQAAPGSPQLSPTGLPLDPQGNIPIPPSAAGNVVLQGVYHAANDIYHGTPPEAISGVTGKDMLAARGIAERYGAKIQPKLDAVSKKFVIQADTAIQEIDELRRHIERLGLTDNNISGYLLKQRLLYMAGRAAKPDSLGADIAALSLTSLGGATSLLAGSSRAMPALHLALEHTPNAWTDSPQQIYDKLGNMRRRLVAMDAIARDPNALLPTEENVVSAPSGMNPPGYKPPPPALWPGAPPVGTIVDGHKYLGGDPNKKESWAEVQVK